VSGGSHHVVGRPTWCGDRPHHGLLVNGGDARARWRGARPDRLGPRRQHRRADPASRPLRPSKHERRPCRADLLDCAMSGAGRPWPSALRERRVNEHHVRTLEHYRASSLDGPHRRGGRHDRDVDRVPGRVREPEHQPGPAWVRGFDGLAPCKRLGDLRVRPWRAGPRSRVTVERKGRPGTPPAGAIPARSVVHHSIPRFRAHAQPATPSSWAATDRKQRGSRGARP
jgi:hypothetical protein